MTRPRPCSRARNRGGRSTSISRRLRDVALSSGTVPGENGGQTNWLLRAECGPASSVARFSASDSAELHVCNPPAATRLANALGPKDSLALSRAVIVDRQDAGRESRRVAGRAS